MRGVDSSTHRLHAPRSNLANADLSTTETVRSLPELLERDVLLGILLHDLRHGHLEVLLRDVDAPLPEREHACTTRFE